MPDAVPGRGRRNCWTAASRRSSPAGRKRLHRPSRIEPPVDPFLEQDGKLRAFLSRYLDSDVEIQPRDVVHAALFLLVRVHRGAGVRRRSRSSGVLHHLSSPSHGRASSRSPAAMLRRCSKTATTSTSRWWGSPRPSNPLTITRSFPGSIRQRSGPPSSRAPFPTDQRKLLIIPQISTKYSDRENGTTRR